MRNVLIIDDEDSLRLLLAQSFEHSGFSVSTADNGEDGLKLAKEKKPDVVVLDLVMPGLHGFEVCKRIREDSSLDQTVVIITSAKSYKPDVDKALELGADAFLVKPVDYEELLRTAKEHFSKRGASV